MTDAMETKQAGGSRDSGTIVRDAVVGVLIGFALSGAFYLIWGAFQLLGFFLWSTVAGGGGAVAGGRIGGSLTWAIVGAVLIRVLIFVVFGGVFF